MRLLLIFLICAAHFSVWAQAEYQKVKELFPVPHTNISVHILKGHLNEVHPVEFFLGQRNDDIKGYYRLVSSGDVFMLEGELINNQLILTESNNEGHSIGLVFTDDFTFESQENSEWNWSSNDQKDLLQFNIKKSDFSAYPPLAFKAVISKFCDYKNNECITIDLFDKDKADIVLRASAQRERVQVLSLDPLSFSVSDSTFFEAFNDKLRARKNGTFQFYEKENDVEIKRTYFASHYLLSDVEYPLLNHKAFDDYVLSIINREREQIKSLVKIAMSKEHLKNDLHFKFNWNGWTEIDFLSSSVISGRIILNLFSPEKTERKVIPFIYDLVENEAQNLEKLFKSEVDIHSFLRKRIIAELQQNKSLKGMEVEEFKYYSLSDQHLLVTTDFNPTSGIQTIKIPYSEIKNWIKRNSLIKKIIRT